MGSVIKGPWQCLDCPLMVAAAQASTPGLVAHAVRKQLRVMLASAPLTSKTFDGRAEQLLSEIDEAYLRSVVR